MLPISSIMSVVPEERETIDALAQLMDEFQLSEASLQQGEFKIAFNKLRSTTTVVAAAAAAQSLPAAEVEETEEFEEVEAGPTPARGNPITSPMAGIFYSSSSPGAPAFVTEGGDVTAGQVVGLIEAMKVFNELTSPFSGKVLKIAAESGSVVQPGEVLILVE